MAQGPGCLSSRSQTPTQAAQLLSLTSPKHVRLHLPQTHTTASTRELSQTHKTPCSQDQPRGLSHRHIPHSAPQSAPGLRPAPPQAPKPQRGLGLGLHPGGNVNSSSSCVGLLRASARGPLQQWRRSPGVHLGSGLMMAGSSASPWERKARESCWCGQGRDHANPLPISWALSIGSVP